MRFLRPLGLLGALVLLAAAPATAGRGSVRLWTETKADAVLLLELRLPCKSVRSPDGCSLRFAQRVAPRTNLMYIEKGFPLRSADCKGGGTHDRGATRFGVFQCRITVYDDANESGPVVVSGKLLITVTGATTFRWQAI